MPCRIHIHLMRDRRQPSTPILRNRRIPLLRPLRPLPHQRPPLPPRHASHRHQRHQQWQPDSQPNREFLLQISRSRAGVGASVGGVGRTRDARAGRADAVVGRRARVVHDNAARGAVGDDVADGWVEDGAGGVVVGEVGFAQVVVVVGDVFVEVAAEARGVVVGDQVRPGPCC